MADAQTLSNTIFATGKRDGRKVGVIRWLIHDRRTIGERHSIRDWRTVGERRNRCGRGNIVRRDGVV